MNDSYSGATSNATIMTYVHNSAKNIIYTVVNSNAAQEYGGMRVEEDNSTPTWKILLYTLDAVVFTACAVGIVLPITLYVTQRVKSNKSTKSSAEE